MILNDAKIIVIERLKEENLLDKPILLEAKVLSTEEAIGNPEEYDFPLLKGKEKIIEANFEGRKGQAFTDMYGGFKGTLKEVFDLEPNNSYRRALQVAAINSLGRYWGLVDDTVHCKDLQPGLCARQSLDWIKAQYPHISRMAFIGYQPAFLDVFSGSFVIKVLDLDEDNIGKEKFGLKIFDGKEYLEDVIEWSELVVSTGSTVVNGTIDGIIEAAGTKDVIFYGVSIAAIAKLVNLKRVCFLE